MEYFHEILLAYTVLHCLDTGIQNKDNASPSIHVAGHGELVKMCFNLEPQSILIKFCLPIHFNIVLPLVCKTVTILCRALVWLV